MVRKENQDFFGKFPEDNLDLAPAKGQLFVVADGMGGHNAGRDASELAVNILTHYYFTIPNDDIAESLRQAFQGTNEHIYHYGTHSPEHAGMGTTCVALVLQDNHACIGSIGDSRIYRITKRRIQQLTQDHSKVAELVRRGILTKEEAKTHPERSHLYRALGTKPVAEVDVIGNINLKNDEYFLMCTDGLYNHVSDKEMQQLVIANEPEPACRALVELANERGGQDNITVQIIHVTEPRGILGKILR
jgi:protein phosphatase